MHDCRLLLLLLLLKLELLLEGREVKLLSGGNLDHGGGLLWDKPRVLEKKTNSMSSRIRCMDVCICRYKCLHARTLEQKRFDFGEKKKTWYCTFLLRWSMLWLQDFLDQSTRNRGEENYLLLSQRRKREEKRGRKRRKKKPNSDYCYFRL